jgi:integrase
VRNPLGSAEEGWTRQKAADQLRFVLADMERGIWRPPDREPVVAPKLPDDPTFHEFASQWFKANEAGWRIGEALDARWRDVDLTAGRITVRASKTAAGRRTIDMLPVLRDELLTLAASRRGGPNERVFGTRGQRQSPSNIRNRVLTPANERLAEAGEVPLPDGLTPHKLRHSYASLLVALGVDPGAVMDQLGHTSAAFSLSVYRHGMRRDQASKDALRHLVGGADWAATGSNGVLSASPLPAMVASENNETPRLAGLSQGAPGRI